VCAQIGVALINQARITEGLLDTVVLTAYKMLISYRRCAQYQRLAQWIQATNRFVERYLQR